LQTELSRIKVPQLYCCYAQLYSVEGRSGSLDIVLNQLQKGMVCLLKIADLLWPWSFLNKLRNTLKLRAKQYFGSAVRVTIVVVSIALLFRIYSINCSCSKKHVRDHPQNNLSNYLALASRTWRVQVRGGVVQVQFAAMPARR
jgi:hypothetical protein